MARAELSDLVVNSQGRPVEEGKPVTIKAVIAPAENVFYTAKTGVGTISAVTTDQFGYFKVWLTEGEYEVHAGAETKVVQVINQASVAAGSVAAEGITTEKLAAESVTTAKIKKEAITLEKLSAAVQAELANVLGAESVTTSNLKSEAVTAGKIASEAIETAKIKALAVTKAKLATAVQEELEKAATKGITSNAQAGNYTLVLGDAEKSIDFTKNTTESKLTVPTHASVAFEVGAFIQICQVGSGQVKIEAAGGVTLRSPTGNFTTRAQYSTVGLRQYALNEFIVSGDLT